jgi:hypothetical protein
MMFSLAIWLEQLRLNALLFRAILQHSFDALQPETAIHVFSIFGTSCWLG